ncbi:hypothetical protein KXW02_007668, partial [Aspergillus fumigatus]
HLADVVDLLLLGVLLLHGDAILIVVVVVLATTVRPTQVIVHAVKKTTLRPMKWASRKSMIPMLRGFGGVGGLGRLADLVRDALGRLPDEPEQRAVGLVVGEHSQGGDDECLVEEHRFHDVALDIGVTELFDLGIAPRPDCDERGTEGLASRQQRLLQRGQNDGVVSENGIGFEH